MKKLLIAVLSLIVILLPVSAQKKKQASGKEPLFGKAMASYPIVSNELSGACFYLVGGHGGPTLVPLALMVDISCMKMNMLMTLSFV